MRSAIAPKAAGHLTWAEETNSGRRRNLTSEEEEAFWAFAAEERLPLTGEWARSAGGWLPRPRYLRF